MKSRCLMKLKERLVLKSLMAVIGILMMIFCASLDSEAVIWHPVDSVVIEWDVALLQDGSPVPAEDSVTYHVYTKNQDGSSVQLIGSTNLLEFTVVVPADTKIFVGVSAQRTMADGTQTEESEINWSDDPLGNYNDEAFGLSNMRNSAAPGGLRKK